MKIIKNLSIFKIKESDNIKAPTHSLSAKIGDSYTHVGNAWTKTSSKGDKFLSVQLAKVYVDNTDNSKSRKSVVMCFEEDLIELHKLANVEYVNEADLPVKTSTTPQNAPKQDEPAF